MTSRLETCRYRDFFLTFFESTGIGLNKFGLEKKSQYESKKNLKNIWSQKESLGFGLENFGLKKVSVTVSKIWVSKSITIGLQRFGLKKSLCNGLKKSLGISIFQDRK